MHAKKLLHKILSETSIHLRRLSVFLEASESLLKGNKLTVTGLGRSLINKVKTKYNINKMNRLIGNPYLYGERRIIYSRIARWIVQGKRRPVVLVDWSSVTPGERYQLLRASVAMEGRSVVLYEEVHPLSSYNQQKVHHQFLEQLKKILPEGCSPIVVTDAGFSVPWFATVRGQGWDFVGRISNTSGYEDSGGVAHKIRDLLNYSKPRVKQLGEILLTKRHQLRCYLQVYKKEQQHRIRYTVSGERAARSVSVQSARRERQAWIIVSSLGKNYTEAKRVIKLYGLRMQIEESFRDLKSHQFGAGLRDSRTQGILRLSNLLLVSSVATVMAWLIGLCAKQKNMHYAFQANSIKSRNVLSLIFIAREVVRHNKDRFRRRDWNDALKQLQTLVQYV